MSRRVPERSRHILNTSLNTRLTVGAKKYILDPRPVLDTFQGSVTFQRNVTFQGSAFVRDQDVAYESKGNRLYSSLSDCAVSQCAGYCRRSPSGCFFHTTKPNRLERAGRGAAPGDRRTIQVLDYNENGAALLLRNAAVSSLPRYECED